MTNNSGKEFIKRTHGSELSPSPQSLGVPLPPLELPYPEESHLIELPSNDKIQVPSIDLREAIEQRRSLRQYTQESLTIDELAFLLWTTQGVQKVTHRPVTFRTVPSAGARHPFETYVLVNRVQGLDKGLYRYIALKHSLLEYQMDEGICEALTHACYDQEQVRVSAVTFFWTAVVERTTWRYVERGYRYILLDAGHICQNFYLAGVAIGCGACAIAAYDDDLLNETLMIDGESHIAIYVASLGKK